LRIHLLGLPHTVSAPWYTTCPFTSKVVKLGRMLTAEGHHVIHYGHEQSQMSCAEHVTVTTNKDLGASYGRWDQAVKGPPMLALGDQAHTSFLTNTIAEIAKRKQPLDIILSTFGTWHKPVSFEHDDLINIEPGIGYPNGAFADFRVFESYAIMHAYQTNKAANEASNDHWYETVIPIAFDTKEFPFREKKEDYLLFMARMNKGKGVHVAKQIAEETKTQLIVAGFPGWDEPTTDSKYVKHVGVIAGRERVGLLSGAKAIICASHYLEPFGAVQLEAQMCGTPVISSDWGSYAEYNPHGLTGYRCRSFEQFVWAANHVHELDTRKIRKWAEGFSLEKIAPHYTDFFQTAVDTYDGKGWYQPRPERTSLRAGAFTNDAFF
jgi:glycosyltransferase involved in cell wall biosynthesis